MSAADQHRAAARRSMRQADESSYADAAGRHRATARTYTLLAIEARLGELVEQQRIANALTGLGVGRAGVFGPGEETAPAIAAVRRLLGLPVEDPAGVKGNFVVEAVDVSAEDVAAVYERVAATARQAGGR